MTCLYEVKVKNGDYTDVPETGTLGSGVTEFTIPKAKFDAKNWDLNPDSPTVRFKPCNVWGCAAVGKEVNP